jgi:hypothetical protein
MNLPSRRVILATVGGGAMLLAGVMMPRDDGAAATRPGGGARARNQQERSTEVPLNDVKLELLQREPAALEEPGRNPFRFEARSAPASARSAGPPGAAAAPQNAGGPQKPGVPQNSAPTGPPPPPAITLKFIGLVEAPTQAGRIAILSDGRGNVFYGKEGDAIEGRYRMLRIAPELVELSYLDGRGRQTIRLSGQ